jgi:dTDP-4-amino-4,6-dideoxygalactose transaminase
MFLAGFRKYLHPSGLYLVRPDSYIFNENLCSWGLSALSQSVLRQTDFKRVKDIRLENFRYLLKYFLNNEVGELPLKELPQGVCPLFFPLILESKGKREKIYMALKRGGVISHPWWDRFYPDIPWKDFPDAVYLKERLFGLPIHQDITFEHLDYILAEFEKAYRGA